MDIINTSVKRVLVSKQAQSGPSPGDTTRTGIGIANPASQRTK